VACVREMKNAYNILIGKPERKRQLGNIAGKNNFKMDLVETE
jgi:hypothetical protein